jgi:hypothetical protein
MPLKFSATISFLMFSEEIVQYPKTFALQVQTPWNQKPMHPLPLQSFPKRPRTQSEASPFGGSHQYKTKQTNYLPS